MASETLFLRYFNAEYKKKHCICLLSRRKIRKNIVSGNFPSGKRPEMTFLPVSRTETGKKPCFRLLPGRKMIRNGVSALFIKNSSTMKLLGDKKQNRLATVKRDSALAKKANGLFAC